MANKKFVAKNGIAVGTGHTTTDIIDQDGHITANTVTISGTLLNATSFAGTANNASYLEGSNGSYYTGYADNKAANAYSNATSYADTAAGTAYSNAASYADNKAANAYSNATSYADTAAGTAYSNAATYADNKAANAYSNAIAYSANATNISSGTLTANVLPTSGVTANTYGNSSSIPVITIDATGRITSATTNAVAGVTGFTYTPSNATFIITTGAGSTFPASISSANDSVAGIVKVLDSVSNTDIYISASANSVKTAYDNAATAYSNAATYADNKAANAYSNATSYAASIAGTAYSNATTFASSAAATAYTNAASYADTKAATAYSNATSYADVVAGTAYTNATSYAATIAGTAYSNATTFASSAAATAYSNAVSAASSSAATAYSNATTFAANASNISSGTLAEARLPFRMDQNVRTNDTVSFGNMTVTGNLTVTGTTVTISATELSIEDNMIYLNSNSAVTNPDLGIAGNYNDGTYRHAGFFRDASDGVWKVYDQYLPEPDASPYIDTANASFRIANFQANVVTAASFSGNGASVTSVDAATVGGNTAGTLRGYSDSTAATAYSNAVSAASSSAATAYSNAVSYAASIAGTAYSNATSYAASIAGTAYSNATSYAATIAGTAYSNAVNYFTTNYTASDVLTKIKTVDGSGSGLDADLLDGIDISKIVYGDNATKTVENNDWNSPISSGFYDQHGPNGVGTPSETYYHMINNRHVNTGNYYAMQISGAFFDVNDFYYRIVNNGTPTSWFKIWHASNDGSGTGLDADLLDGQHGSYYAANSSLSSYLPLTGGTLTGTLTGVSGAALSFNGGTTTASSYNYVLAAGNDSGNRLVIFVNGTTRSDDGGTNATTIRNDGGALNLGSASYSTNLIGSSINASGSTIWHAGNDGAGSGLDADLLDGLSSGSFLRKDANDSTSAQYTFSKTDDHAISVGTIRGRAVGSQGGDYIHMYERVHIGSPSGWGSRSAPTYGLSTYGGCSLATDTGSVTIAGSTAWHAGNDGSGSGLDADLLDGINSIGLYNNMGQPHSTRTGFDTTPNYDFGYRFVQGNANGPGTGGSQFYSWYIGLGSEYPATGAGSYGAMFAVDRNTTTPYLSVRWNESNSFSAWYKIRAGYADSSGGISGYSGTYWTSANDGSGSGLDADLLDGYSSSALLDGAEQVKDWGNLSASGEQARRYTIGRVYGTPNHWIDAWQNIRIKIIEDSYNSGYVEYDLHGFYGMGDGNSWVLRVKDAGGSGDIDKYRISLGTVTYAGWTYAGANTYYQDIYLDVAYYKTVRVIARTYGHGYTNSNPGSGTGAHTTFYDSPSGTNISYTNDDKYTSYLVGSKIWNISNDGSGSGLDADLWDGYQFSDYLNQAVKNTSAPSFSGLTVTANKFLLNSDSGAYGQLQINSPNTSTEATVVFGSGGSGQNNGGYTYAGVIGLGAYGLSKANFYFGAGYSAPAMFIPNSSAHAEASNSFRAPIFYDSANTSCYLDLAENATAYGSVIRSGVLFGPNYTWGAYLLVGGNGKYSYGENSGDVASVVTTNGNLHLDSGSGKSTYINYYDGDNVYFGNGGQGIVAQVAGDGSFRSPVYYDYANTSFFVDPASRSRLASIDLGNSSYYMTQGDWGWRHVTPDGWIQFGPANSGHAHIYTDRSNFYFNVNTLYTNGNLVWTAGNDGSGSGLDADTLDGVNLSTSATASTVAGRDSSGRLYTHLGEVNKNSDWVAAFQGTPVSGYTWHGDISTGGPTGAWWFYESMRHSNSSNYWGTQIAWGWEDNANQLYQRNVTSNSWSGWVKYWNSGNDGSGSGLDADTLDGVDSSGFVNTTNNSGLNSDSRNTRGVTRLYRRDDNSDYSVQTYWTGSYWRLYGYSGDSGHADTHVGYADSAGSATTADQIDGWAFRNTGSNTGTAADSIASNGITYVSGNISLYGQTDGALFSQAYSGDWQHQIYGDYRTGQIAIRGKNSGTWQSWRVVLDSSNYTSYTGGLGSVNTWTNTNYFRSNRNTTSSDPPLQAYSNDAGGAIMAFHRGGYYAVNFGLDSDNVMRIGGWSASANRWQLDMSGNMTAAGNITAYSDIRLKKDIQVIENAIEKVKQIRGVTFTRIDKGNEGAKQAGVIAQEVELVLPEVVSEDNSGIKNVAYGNMVGLLIEAIKEQQKQIEELKAALLNK